MIKMNQNNKALKISKKQGIKDRSRLITLINDWENYRNNEKKF